MPNLCAHAYAPMPPKVNSIGRLADPLTVELLEINFRDDMASNMIVMLVRFITSAEVQLRQEFFLPFIMVRALWSTS